MKSITLVPAYGRDYKSQAEIKADIAACKDFTIADFFHPYDGKPCQLQDLASDGYTHANIRYSSLRKIAVVKL